MTNELTVSTPEEYVQLTTKKVKVTSEAVFHIHAMNASSMVYLLGKLPEEGFEGRDELNRFVEEHFIGIVEHVVQPNIIAPKVGNEHLFFLDVVDLLTALMDISGFTVEETDKSFRDEGSSYDT